MDHQEAKDIFTNESSWTLNQEALYYMAEQHGILYCDDDEFGQVASQVWDYLSDSEKDGYCEAYDAYLAQ